MTTKFIEPDWKGKTVVVLGGGPSFNVPLAESLRHHVCIAVSYVAKLVPWADAMLALDGNVEVWDDITAGYAGIKMCGTPSDQIDGMFVGSCYEAIKLAPLRTIEIRNSGLAAIRIAARCGASRILLVGFDPETYTHAAGYPASPDDTPHEPYPHMIEGLAAVVASVRASGVTVEFVAPSPAPEPAPAKPTLFSKKSRSTT